MVTVVVVVFLALVFVDICSNRCIDASISIATNPGDLSCLLGDPCRPATALWCRTLTHSCLVQQCRKETCLGVLCISYSVVASVFVYTGLRVQSMSARLPAGQIPVS